MESAQRLGFLNTASGPSIKQLMVVNKKTGKGWFNRGIAMALLFRIEHDLLQMSVKEFVRFMQIYTSHNDWVYVQGIWSGRERGQVWELAGTNISVVPASTIHCKFYGGPAGARTYYKGTLLTMLCDRVMNCALETGMEAARPLFPNEVLTN